MFHTEKNHGTVFQNLKASLKIFIHGHQNGLHLDAIYKRKTKTYCQKPVNETMFSSKRFDIIKADTGLRTRHSLNVFRCNVPFNTLYISLQVVVGMQGWRKTSTSRSCTENHQAGTCKYKLSHLWLDQELNRDSKRSGRECYPIHQVATCQSFETLLSVWSLHCQKIKWPGKGNILYMSIYW